MTRRPRGVGDDGAAAVEFALVSMLLFMLLFGIIQYGFTFYQMQAASSTARDAARLAAVGISGDCSAYRASVNANADANQLPRTEPTWRVTTTFSGGTATNPQFVTVAVRFAPSRLTPIFVPAPAEITRTAQARVEDTRGFVTTCTESP